MKIAVLGTRGFPDIQGGVESHCEHLYPRLVRKGCDVTIFTREPYTGNAVREYEGVKLLPLRCPKNKFLEAFIHTFIGVFAAKRIDPDILHIHAIGPSVFVPLARFLGMRVVMTNHGPDYKRKKWGIFARIVLRAGETAGSIFSNEVICISSHIGDDIAGRFKRRVFVIPNGVDVKSPSESQEMLKKYSLAKNRYILAVGRFVPEKGFGDLIDAFSLIQGGMIAGEKWKLVIVGASDHKDRYAASIEERAGRNPDIVLTGSLTGTALEELYSHAGLFVLPSYYEGMPIVLLEAMSYGLSCIASDIPPNKKLGLADERYFKVGDIHELKEKISIFAGMLKQEHKKCQIELVRKRFNWDDVAIETLNVYMVEGLKCQCHSKRIQ